MTARRARWSGVLVSDTGRAVLLPGTTGTLVFPAPHDATPPVDSFFLIESGDALLLENGTDQLILEGP